MNPETRLGAKTLLLALALSLPCLGNTPPLIPTILEPEADGLILNAEDVHMAVAPFSDPDLGDAHHCSDWEIWAAPSNERVWSALCVAGVNRVHIHLADGAFEGSHAGRQSLLAEAEYYFRVRFRDDSGDPATEWSPWAQRYFSTGAASVVFPLRLDDVEAAPAPAWTDLDGVPILLDGGIEPPSLTLESAQGHHLLSIEGAGGSAYVITNPGALPEHVAVRVRIEGGSGGIVIPDSDVHFSHDGADQGVYLPGVVLDAGETALFWVAQSGGTYVASPAQIEPDFSTLARGAPVPWTVSQPGYQVEIFARGLQLPVNIAFIPNPSPASDAPFFYVTELYGTVQLVRRNGVVSTFADELLNFDPTGQFPGSGELGVTGIVVEPESGDVIISLLYNAAPPSGPLFARVVRFQSHDGGVTAGQQSTILDLVGEVQGASHQISNLSIGPDGMLYVHMGDGFHVPAALDLNSLRGKVLRVTLDGAPPSDNPFYDDADGITARDYVYAYGFRNPFGGAWRASDQRHYQVENGPAVDRLALIQPGVGYGWNGTNESMFTNALYNWVPAHAPVNIAFIQPSTFGGSGFPPEKQEHGFVTESGPTWATGQQIGKRITEFTIDPDGNITEGPRDLIVYNGEGKATAAGLAAGPDGLYFTDLYRDVGYTTPIDRGANVLRIRYVGSADFTAEGRIGPGPRIVHFSDLSTGQPATDWLWDFGDGTTSTLRNPTHTYFTDGGYDVRLSVTTPAGVLFATKHEFVRVRPLPSLALIGGTIPPIETDAAVVAYLEGQGYQVRPFDDEGGNRPTAAELADEFDCVVVSSSVSPGNVGGDFRSVKVPLVFWEQGLLRPGREPLSDDGVVRNTSSINLVDTSHAITSGFDGGDLQVFASSSRMSLARGDFGAGAQVLATRPGSAEAALVAAETGAPLIGYTAPDRRVFVFFEDTSFQDATADALTLFRRSINWAADDPPVGCIGDLDSDRDVDLDDLAGLLTHYAADGVSLSEGDLDHDADVDLNDLSLILTRFGVTCP